MLKEISIKNFAIIDDLNIQFTEGLNVLSGETGAGKSIIINAVNLLLGSRASASLIRSGASTAELEAIFYIPKNSKVVDAMKANGFDASEELLIRRIISQNNRHKIYVNGHLSTIQILTEITEGLASISGQHAHQKLLIEDQHLLILDQFGGLMPLRNKAGRLFQDILPLIRKLKELHSHENRQKEHLELLEFQKKEIEDASLLPGEDETSEQERLRLKNGEQLYKTVYESIEELYGAQGAITERLSEIQKNIEKASQIDPELSSRSGELGDAMFRLEDITEGLRGYIEGLQVDERRLEDVEERIDFINRLKRKYGGSLESVLLHLESVDKELSEIGNLSESITETEQKLSEAHGKLEKTVWELSKKRVLTAEKIAKKVENGLASLKMPKTKFAVSLDTIPAESTNDYYLTTQGKSITDVGIDRATFLIAPNVGEELKPLASIASGGELSRMVLAIKAMMAGKDSLSTVVFDEVDSGIGGDVAEVVGKKLFELSQYHQIICITHLAQIAKFGNQHYKISKKVSGGRTKTDIRSLEEKERVNEIARMIGGEKITKVTLDYAKEMLQKN